MTNEKPKNAGTIAAWDIDLNLPDSNKSVLCEASQAIKREYQDSAKWKRLKCRKAEEAGRSGSATVFRLEIDHAIEFDWTWEGATAFRPNVLREFEEGLLDGSSKDSCTQATDEAVRWTGEVLEVDETNGAIYIAIENPEAPPHSGTFYVRPFEFLTFLNSIYNEPQYEAIREYLPSRLLASKGNLHPELAEGKPAGQGVLPAEMWDKSWSSIWGPPGTGKTYTTGEQVAEVLPENDERILVVSTTNKATDAVALSIARAMARRNDRQSKVRRIGKGASYQEFAATETLGFLEGTETEFLAKADSVAHQLAAAKTAAEKAMLRLQLKEIRAQMKDASAKHFFDPQIKVVVATAFKATVLLCKTEIRENLELGKAPFTTIFIDESGLVSRVATSALSLLASRRVVLVGDSKQLAPISRISRVIEPKQGNWLCRSGISHLTNIGDHVPGIHVLTEQRRMHPEICDLVSKYQYDGVLTTSKDIINRKFNLPSSFRDGPRALWYVLDQDANDKSTIRSERGPGSRSWIRTGSIPVMQKLFQDPAMRSANGMFITPFKAQAKKVQAYFAENNWSTWSSSTVHSQQGAEADIVLFDTVNAGSYGWAYEEWKRLVNVAISRARELVIILASQAEMAEPYLRPLQQDLDPGYLNKAHGSYHWAPTGNVKQAVVEEVRELTAEYSLGKQLKERKELRPVMSKEQERLCALDLDGKPRLVRGVAGSGKTIVLAHWLMQTMEKLSGEDVRIWAVFANRSLQALIGNSLEEAWNQRSPNKPFPWERVDLKHVKEVIDKLLPEAGIAASRFGFDYDSASKAFLDVVSASDVHPRCDALFIDEAQDLGPNTLKLLSILVRQSDPSDVNSRSVNIFYDNAQNIYDRRTPKWSELGLDMRGRSTVMKESFRSTKPITELSLNVLYRLQPPDSNSDHKELLRRGLIEKRKQGGHDWWRVRFNQIDGPKPEFRRFVSLEKEFQAIGEYCRSLISDESVSPADICILYNGKNIPFQLKRHTIPVLSGLDVELSVQTNRPYQRSDRMLLATTSHSFKGYDSEIVIVAGVDQFKAKNTGILASNLYVAMTRARSTLTLFSQSMKDSDSQLLYRTLEDCLDQLTEAPEIEVESSVQDDLFAILERIGEEHRSWLLEIFRKQRVLQEPLVAKSGELLAEPLFHFRHEQVMYACFGRELPSNRVLRRLEDLDIRIVRPGEVVS